MVTLLYILVLLSSVLLVSIVDTFLYNQPLLDTFLYVLYPEPGTRKIISVSANVLAFIVALVIDYRIQKNKQTTQEQIEGKKT
jgi:multisubunit Na+/H+ antiporter MnhB subunit